MKLSEQYNIIKGVEFIEGCTITVNITSKITQLEEENYGYKKALTAIAKDNMAGLAQKFAQDCLGLD